MNAQITQRLEDLFALQRVVFWHDADHEYAGEVAALDLPEVTVLIVDNNEFGIKHRILSENGSKFLVYRGGEIPTGVENWLLDQELAYGVFTADRASLTQQDLGIAANSELASVIADYPRFFASAERVKAIREVLAEGDGPVEFQAKMCQIVVRAPEKRLNELVAALLRERAEGKQEKLGELEKYGLSSFLWKGIGDIYGYQSESPGLDDFILWMFELAYQDFVESEQRRTRIESDFKGWVNSVQLQATMRELACYAQDNLTIVERISSRDYTDLLDLTVFEAVEQKIISELATTARSGLVSAQEIERIRDRRQYGLWYQKYRDHYEAIYRAGELIRAIENLPTDIESFDAGLEGYRDTWYLIDQNYRYFITSRHRVSASVLDSLQQEVESRYTNKYLYEFGAIWQKAVDQVENWSSTAIASQREFYARHVERMVSGGNVKAVVIVSDALRYEIAAELTDRIRQMDRYQADLSAQLGVLPSYTQLGMAALLPHNTLSIDPSSSPAYVDGNRSDGTEYRNKILQQVEGCAIKYSDVTAMNREARRKLYSEHRVIYIYHNHIDAIGDKMNTESGVFDAAQKAQDELIDLVKKLTTANATNIFITADHGFLYQDSEPAATFYMSEDPKDDGITARDRRFVLGRNLRPRPAYMHYDAAQLGLDGDLETLIPKSIHRFRKSGSGARYVHGGAALQEIVVPVISINKRRQSDVRNVNVQIIQETDRITTGQISVKLFQVEPVAAKVQGRNLRVGLYAGDTLISEQLVLTFDQSSEEPRDRYQQVALHLNNEADQFNGRDVELRVEEPISGTSRWSKYQTANYRIQTAFGRDFDF